SSASSPQLGNLPQLSSREGQTPTTRNGEIPPTLIDEDNKPGSAGKTGPHKTRRNILIGGAAALVAVGAGTGVWAFATHQSLFSPRPVLTGGPHTPSNPAPDPNGPTFLLREHTKPAHSLVWSPTQNSLYSAAKDSSIKRWDIDQFQNQK